MSGQVSRGSAGEYQGDERAGVSRSKLEDIANAALAASAVTQVAKVRFWLADILLM